MFPTAEPVFQLALVMAPPATLDYIVVHELAHLIEPYHSTKFWLIVRPIAPNLRAIAAGSATTKSGSGCNGDRFA